MKRYTLFTVLFALLGTPGYSTSTATVPGTTPPVAASTPSPIGAITGTPKEGKSKKEGWAEKKAAKKAAKAKIRCDDGVKDWVAVSSYARMFDALRDCATDCLDSTQKASCIRVIETISKATKGTPLNLGSEGRKDAVFATKKLIKKASKFMSKLVPAATVPAVPTTH